MACRREPLGPSLVDISTSPCWPTGPWWGKSRPTCRWTSLSSARPIGAKSRSWSRVPDIFIGHDRVDALAAEVCASSIRRRSARPLRFLRLSDHDVSRAYKRPFRRDGGQLIDLADPRSQVPFSTEFAFSRFLVPYLREYKGWALFTDPDTLWTRSVDQLFSLADDNFAVMVVKHDHRPTPRVKMHNIAQTAYERKNWSSVCLWNCEHPSNRMLTPDVVNRFPGRWLHAFKWLDDAEIGALPAEWNWLVGADPVKDAGWVQPPSCIHFTSGGPWLRAYRGVRWSQLWLEECQDYRPEVR